MNYILMYYYPQIAKDSARIRLYFEITPIKGFNRVVLPTCPVDQDKATHQSHVWWQWRASGVTNMFISLTPSLSIAWLTFFFTETLWFNSWLFVPGSWLLPVILQLGGLMKRMAWDWEYCWWMACVDQTSALCSASTWSRWRSPAGPG